LRGGLGRGLVAFVVLLSVFWTLTNVAISRGEALAASLEQSIGRRPAIVVHSSQPLGITAPGVTEEQQVPGVYTYSGLRLLQYREGRVLLVNDGWTRRHGVTVLLADDPDLRFEIITGTAPTP
jgi:hypothetical protein